MANDEIKGEGYAVRLDRATGTVTMQGSLRLMDSNAYAPILALLEEGLRSAPETMVLDVRPLKFLNSAGIQTLLRLTAKLREAQRGCVILASRSVPWHAKSLRTFQLLLPALDLRLE